MTSIAIAPEEHRARCDALLERARADGLAGVVLFDPHYVLYYSGFAFVPTERPIALVLGAKGERALVVHGSSSSTRSRARRSTASPLRRVPR